MVDLGPVSLDPYVPKPGDIGLTTISDWGGRGIKAAQALMGCSLKAMQHAYTVTSIEDDGTTMIVEAMPGGADHGPNWHPNSVFLRCPDEYRPFVAQAAINMTGVPYSWLDYEAIALHHMHVPAPWLKTYISSTGHQICSQLSDEAALRGGWHLFDDNRWPGYVPPCDLWKLWKQQQHALLLARLREEGE